MSLLVVVLGLAGCGQDLSKANYEATTVPPEPGSGATEPVPEGAIDEPELSVDKLRTVDACKSFGEEQLSLLGTLEPNPYTQKPDECGRTLKDKSGADVRISLKIGENLAGLRDKASGGLEGLPLRENKLDAKVCFVEVLTQEKPEIGLKVHISYESGNSCGAGRRVMAKVIQTLKGDPPQVDADEGSVMTADPCKAVDESTVKSVAGDAARKEPSGLHGCSLRGTGPIITVDFRVSSGPPVEGQEKVKLSDSVTAQQHERSKNNCQLQWQHKKLSDTEYELVQTDYTDYSSDADIKTACKKATTLAKAVFSKLKDA